MYREVCKNVNKVKKLRKSCKFFFSGRILGQRIIVNLWFQSQVLLALGFISVLSVPL